jgi:hypothetical protein
MKKNIFLLFLFLPFFLQAQTADSVKIITLHPSVGKSIDVKEKKEFYLFPDYNDSIFESAEILKYNDSTYTIRFKTTTGNFFEKPTNTKELDAMYAKVDRIKPAEYVETKHDRESRRSSSRNENAEWGYHVGSIILQVLLITLSILIHSSY